MRVAILHYHLKPGGVTRVIENTIRELEKAGIESLVFCSEQPDQKAFPFNNVRVVPGLAYNNTFDANKVETLKSDLESICRNEWGDLPDLWHVHNHSLAKNLELPVVISQWAQEGQKLLLQIHDFAEDGRPDNYKALLVTLAKKDPQNLSQILYPVGDHVAYAFINGRDRSFFKQVGVDEARCHLLANPVWLEIDQEAQLDDPSLEGKRLFLYPTRSIRRKNLGEFLLWAAAAHDDVIFGSTLAPANPTALPIYEDWVRLADQLNLPVRFGLGQQHRFDALLNAAHTLVTTSIAEGFGLAYLEPYLISSQLVGRDLPDITSDFTRTGIRLDGLYPRLDVPIAWVGKERLRQTIHESLISYYQSYRQTFQKFMVEEALEAILQGDMVDFGYLDESMQADVIKQVAQNSLLKLDFAPEKLDCFLSDAGVKRNREIIKRQFNPEAYGQRLLGIYEGLACSKSTPAEFLDTPSVLNCFLDPKRFNLLRT